MTAEIIRFPKAFQGKVKKARDELTRHPIASAIKSSKPHFSQTAGEGKAGQTKPLFGVNTPNQKANTAKTSHSKGGGVWSLLWSLLVLFWPIISFLFWIDVLWHGLLAIIFSTTPNTHYGALFLVHFLIFFSLGVSRYIVPKGI